MVRALQLPNGVFGKNKIPEITNSKQTVFVNRPKDASLCGLRHFSVPVALLGPSGPAGSAVVFQLCLICGAKGLKPLLLEISALLSAKGLIKSM